MSTCARCGKRFHCHRLCANLPFASVARLTGADYEFHHHAPELKKAGASDAQLEALDDPDAAATSSQFDEFSAR